MSPDNDANDTNADASYRLAESRFLNITLADLLGEPLLLHPSLLPPADDTRRRLFGRVGLMSTAKAPLSAILAAQLPGAWARALSRMGFDDQPFDTTRATRFNGMYLRRIVTGPPVSVLNDGISRDGDLFEFTIASANGPVVANQADVGTSSVAQAAFFFYYGGLAQPQQHGAVGDDDDMIDGEEEDGGAGNVGSGNLFTDLSRCFVAYKQVLPT